MRKIIILTCLLFFVFSCTKQNQNKRKQIIIKSEKITCDKFNINTNLSNNILSLSIDSDLPDFTDVTVSVSRSYWRKGNTDEYSVDYFKEKSKLQKWKNNQKILVNNSIWETKLEAHQSKMSKLGSDFQFTVDKVSNDINISVIVPIKQSNSAFGKRNVNLTGKEVIHKNINVIHKDVQLKYPISGYTIQEKPKINTTIKQTNLIKLDGKWIDNTGAMKGIIHVYVKNGIIQVDTHCSDGSIYSQTAIIKTINNIKRYYVSDSAENEYFIFGESNEMRWFDNYGLFEVYKKQTD